MYWGECVAGCYWSEYGVKCFQKTYYNDNIL